MEEKISEKECFEPETKRERCDGWWKRWGWGWWADM